MTLRLAGSTSGYTEIDAPAVAGSNTLVLPGGNGTNGQVLSTNGSGVLSWSSISVTQLGSAATASGTDLQFNSGYGSVATAYGCRAWVNFNGTGVVAIRASGNVSSITDNGTGDYTVNFTTAMPDGNYSVTGSTTGTSNGDGAGTFQLYGNAGGGAVTKTTTQTRITYGQSNTGGVQDRAECNFAVFR